MDILSYLTSLIKTRKEVGIPGLGTIYKKKTPGRYDAETHSFLPPSYVLEFTEEIRESEALINYISKQRNISADASSYYVEKFAEDIHQQIQENHQASLHPLGMLSDHSGQLEFKADSTQNFGFDFYGLPALKDEVITESTVTAPEEKPAAVTEVPEIEEPDTKAPYADEALLAETPVETAPEEETPLTEETGETAGPLPEEVPVETETEEVGQVTEATDVSADPLPEETLPEPETENTATEAIETEEVPVTVTPEDNTNTTAELPPVEEAEENPETTSTAEDLVPAAEDPLNATDEAIEEPVNETQETETTQQATDAPSAPVVTLPVSEDPLTVTAATEEPTNEVPETEAPASHLTEVIEENRVEEENPGDEFAAPVETQPYIEPQFHKIEEVTPVEKEEPFTINERYARNQFITPEPPEPVRPEGTFYNSNEEEQEKKSVPLYLKILITLLLILIGVAAVYFIRPDLFKGLFKPEEAPAPITKSLESVNTQPADSLAMADSLNKSSQTATPATAKKDSAKAAKTTPAVPVKTPATAPAETKTETAQPVKLTAAAAGITYEVIGSGVSSQHEADKFIAQMKKIGINAKAIAPEHGRKKIKISIGTFNDYNAAHAEKPKLEKKLGIKGLYIYTNKPE